jgi:hypothetical protein
MQQNFGQKMMQEQMKRQQELHQEQMKHAWYHEQQEKKKRAEAAQREAAHAASPGRTQGTGYPQPRSPYRIGENNRTRSSTPGLGGIMEAPGPASFGRRTVSYAPQGHPLRAILVLVVLIALVAASGLAIGFVVDVVVGVPDEMTLLTMAVMWAGGFILAVRRASRIWTGD